MDKAMVVIARLHGEIAAMHEDYTKGSLTREEYVAMKIATETAIELIESEFQL